MFLFIRPSLPVIVLTQLLIGGEHSENKRQKINIFCMVNTIKDYIREKHSYSSYKNRKMIKRKEKNRMKSSKIE